MMRSLPYLFWFFSWTCSGFKNCTFFLYVYHFLVNTERMKTDTLDNLHLIYHCFYILITYVHNQITIYCISFVYIYNITVSCTNTMVVFYELFSFHYKIQIMHRYRPPILLYVFAYASNHLCWNKIKKKKREKSK